MAAQATTDYVRTRVVNTTVDDRDWFPTGLPAFPREVLPTSPKLEWTRQVLLVKSANPLGPAYLVLRDTTHGGQPTVWQFWTLSEKIGTPAQAADANFLADKPGKAILPSRELPMSDRYTAVGQQGVDVEYFIASPANTPRYTLRYGGRENGGVQEWQDLLHLRQPGDGAYYMVLYPRPQAEAPPAFSTLADGKIIKVDGGAWMDYAFLVEEPIKAEADGVTFNGTSGAVQITDKGATLTLGAAGEVKYKEVALAADGPATLQFAGTSLTLTLPAGHAAMTVTLTAPVGFKGDGVKADGTQYTVTVPAGVTTVTLK
jgi:hypothetical protein